MSLYYAILISEHLVIGAPRPEYSVLDLQIFPDLCKVIIADIPLPFSHCSKQGYHHIISSTSRVSGLLNPHIIASILGNSAEPFRMLQLTGRYITETSPKTLDFSAGNDRFLLSSISTESTSSIMHWSRAPAAPCKVTMCLRRWSNPSSLFHGGVSAGGLSPAWRCSCHLNHTQSEHDAWPSLCISLLPNGH